MKVLLLCNRVPYPINDGWVIAITEEIKTLQSIGCSVELLCFNTSKHFVSDDEITYFKQQFSVKLHVVNIDNRVTYVGILKDILFMRSYHITRFKSNAFQLLFIELVSKGSFDVIHFEVLPMLWYHQFIPSNFKGRSYYRAHNIEHLIWKRIAKNTTHLFKKLYLHFASNRLKSFEVEYVKGIESVIAISSSDAFYFKELGVRQVHTIPSAINSKFLNGKVSQGNKGNIGFIGALDWMPNQEGIKWFLEKVEPILMERIQNYRINIAGKNTPSYFHRYCSEKVHILGTVDSVQQFLEVQEIIIIPLHSGSGMKLKLAEAMAVGKPIVATTIAKEGFEIEDKKHFIEANTVGEFIEAIELLLKNKELCNTLSHNAKAWAKANHGLEFIGAKYLSVYKG